MQDILISEEKVEAGFSAAVNPSSLGKTVQPGGSVGAVLIFMHWQSVLPTWVH